MNLICYLSNNLAEEPVVSPSSGHVFEKRLIYKFLEENGNKDPVNNQFLNKDMLVHINKKIYESYNIDLNETKLTLTDQLKILQEEWDALILKIFYLKKQLFLSNEEKDKLIFKQNDYIKLIDSLKNEIIELKKNSCDNENIYENLSLSQCYSVNKENLFDQVSFKKDSKCNLTQNDFVEPNYKYSNFNHDIFPYNKNSDFSLSSEYVNLKTSLLNHNHRTKSVIFQNDQSFHKINSNENFNQCRRKSQLFRPKSEIQISPNLKHNCYDYCNISSELLFLDKKNNFNSLNCHLSNLSDLKIDKKLNNEYKVCPDKLTFNYNRNYENILLEDEIDNLISNKKNQNIINSNQSISSDVSKYSNNSSLSNSKNVLTNLNKFTNLDHIEIKPKSTRIVQWSEDFDKLLHDSIGINIFTQFLFKEHSKENIDFWLICEKYKNLTNKEDLKKNGTFIYNKYLSDKAKFPINVNSEAKTQVEKDFKKNNFKKELFVESQKQIFELMKFDSYKRFLESDLYKKCLENEKSNKSLPIELINGSIDKTEFPINTKKNRRKSLIWIKKQK